MTRSRFEVSRGRIGIAMLVLAAAAVAILVLNSGGSDYRVGVTLTSADGLRQGSQVKVGGVPVGTVSQLGLGPQDAVQAELQLDPGTGRIGKGARIEIVTSNLLGSKFINLAPGDTKHPQPSGARISASQVTTPTDLDQVLDTLDADTQTRLQILINELGTATTGRRADFNQALKLLPQDLDAGQRVLSQVVADNHTLGRLVSHGSRFVSRINAERHTLSRVVDLAGQALDTTAMHRAALRQTLARAPGTLRDAQRFLADLRATTVPLGPASRAIADTAPELTNTLGQLPAFQRAAQPALRRAIGIAPELTRLGVQASPVVRRLNPTLSSLAAFARAAVPVTHTADVSIDDLLGVVEAWSRAIQGRDGISHIFHGRATLGPDFIRSIVSRAGNVPGLPGLPGLPGGLRAGPQATTSPRTGHGATSPDHGGGAVPDAGAPTGGPGTLGTGGSTPSVRLFLDYLLRP